MRLARPILIAALMFLFACQSNQQSEGPSLPDTSTPAEPERPPTTAPPAPSPTTPPPVVTPPQPPAPAPAPEPPGIPEAQQPFVLPAVQASVQDYELVM